MYFNCKYCGKEKVVKKTTRTDSNRFCNNACQGLFQFENETLVKFKNGQISNRPTLKKIITKLHGYKCGLCPNIGEHNGMPLALQLDHRDGNAGNDFPDNVRLLCPNCHSQTSTFAAKNKGCGRGSRSLKR